MNKNIVRALFDDALAQVLDNIGFRILAILFLIPVLLTFVVGLGQEELVFFFYWRVPYDALLAGFDAGQFARLEPRDMLLSIVEFLMLDVVADKFGILFAVGAVSFFMPRMLEKGAADTVFSKPVSRLALMLSRYVAGLLFVVLLATLLVGGMYVGFRVASGYDNTGILWGIATLTYGFAVFHAISVVIGVFTRSTVAAFLLAFLFMPVNCGVHQVWRWKELNNEITTRVRKPDADTADKARQEKEDESVFLTGFKRSFAWGTDVAHYLLPKTSDTTLIARDLRKRVEDADKEFTDDDTKLSIAEAPRGFTREPRSSFNQDDGLLWIAPHPARGGEARWTLKKAKYNEVGSRNALVKALEKRLAEDPNVTVVDGGSKKGDIGGHLSERVEWREKRGSETRLRRQWLVQSGDHMLTLDYDAEVDWAELDPQETAARAFVAGFRFQDDDAFQRQQVDVAYEGKFGWDAPLKYNAWFSIGSTLAFIVLVLALGWWKLSRIDF